MLKKNYEFKNVLTRGKYYGGRQIEIFVLKNKKPFVMLGIAVSKKVGNSVVRSRCKRLISESFRLNYENVKKGYDFVFIARKPLKDKSYFEVEKAMQNLLKKAGLYNNEENIDKSNKIL